MAWDRDEYQKKITEKARSRFVRKVKVQSLTRSIDKLERRILLAKDRRAKEQLLIMILDRHIGKLTASFILFGEKYHVPSDQEIAESLTK
jgi:hypothetical protein